MSSWKCRVSCTIRPPAVEDGGLAAHLEAHRPLDRAQRVDVLGLGAGAPLEAADRGERDVDVAAQVALLHPDLGDPERPHDLAQLGDVGAGHLGGLRAGAGDRPGDDLDQRDAGPVVVDQRVVGAVDAAGGAADVQVLAGVLLEVHPLDLDAVGLAVDLDVQVPGGAERLVVLAWSGSPWGCPGRSSSSGRTGTRWRSGSPAPGRSGWSPRSRPRWPPAARRAGPGRPGRSGCWARRRRWSSSRRTSSRRCRARRGSPGR